MPVLSKRWAGLLRVPSSAWGKLEIDTEQEFPDNIVADAAGAAAWFGRRAGSVTVLRVNGTVPRLPASLVATILMSQAKALTTLYLDVGATRLSSADLGVLAAISSLVHLEIHLPSEPLAEWDDYAAAVIGTLSRLPELETLQYTAFQNSAMPTVSELVTLHSPVLLEMGWGMTSTADGILILGALPSLNDCHLTWDSQIGHVLHVTPASFGGATGLTSLLLRCHNQVQLEGDCFNSLSVLEDLTLRKCGPTAIPAALSAMQGTLRVLDLSSNRELQIDQAGLATLLALSVLESIDLHEDGAP